MMNGNTRRFGILLHPTSLPGRYGIGDLGPEAHRFVDVLREMGVRLWQVLPLGPTGWGHSPYQSPSTFAGNPLLISLEVLEQEGLLPPGDPPRELSEGQDCVNYERVREYKEARLRQAFGEFTARKLHESREFLSFCADNVWWLQDFSMFMAMKHRHAGRPWTEWEPSIAHRDHTALDHCLSSLHDELTYVHFVQYTFFRQWRALREHANERGILIMGDIPIFVAHDSADVWAHPELYRLQPDGRPLVVAGVPPDCFSDTGQLWGNPVYDWDEMKRQGYRWWLDRVRHTLRMVDMIRLDHFRGFEAYWGVPADHETAENGAWVPAPGNDFFQHLQRELGELPLVAEDLGFITPEVERMRRRFNLPGMAILQFAFGKEVYCGVYRPHDWEHQTVAYTGTHDNDTVVGWWSTVRIDDPEAPREWVEERIYARDYLNIDGEGAHWAFLRCLISSVCHLTIAPLQDVLGLGGEARMNFPGRINGNWQWRFRWEMLTDETKGRLRRLLEVYDRLHEARPSLAPLME